MKTQKPSPSNPTGAPTTTAAAGGPGVTHAAAAAPWLELRRELRALPAKKRLDRILERPDAMKVVRALPVHDLFATVREVGIDDCLELLELCSPRQVQAFLDLDGWRADRIDSASMSSWLRALFAANADRAVGQVRGLDIELLTLLFKLHARVYDLSAEEEPQEEVGLHTITPDRRFLIAYGGVGADERMHHVLKELVERLCARDMLFVLRLCEAVRWELPSSLEEESFRWRNARLADIGIQPRHEAVEVFGWIEPDVALDAQPPAPEPRAFDPEAPSTDLSTSVVFPWEALSEGASVVAQASKDLPLEVRERIAREAMLVANRVHVADGGDAGDAEALRATARQVLDTVGIAVAYRSAGDPQRLGPLMAGTPLLTLFRIGHALGLKLQRELRARIGARDSGLLGHGLLRLDAPLREAAAGLLRPRPLLYAGLTDAKRVDYHVPTSLLELAALSRAVAEMGFRAALLGPRGFGATDDALARLGAEDPAAHPSHGAMLGAMLVRLLLEENPTSTHVSLGPVDAAALASVRPHLMDAARARRVEQLVVERARAFAPLPGAATGDDVAARTAPYVRQVLAALASELGAIDGAPEARFVASVWCR